MSHAEDHPHAFAAAVRVWLALIPKPPFSARSACRLPLSAIGIAYHSSMV
jgi:hypothetical protein